MVRFGVFSEFKRSFVVRFQLFIEGVKILLQAVSNSLGNFGDDSFGKLSPDERVKKI